VKLTERNHPEAGRRWPRSVFGVGTEPDPRFTFANERTFLAWIRTALALLAAGISLDTFVTKFPEALRTAVSTLLVLTGAACGGLAYRRWMASERALRLNKPLPAPIIAPVLGYGVVLVGVSFAVVLLVRR
jgi:putative membrane protein